MWETGFDPWVGKISWRRTWQSTPVLLPGKSHGWRSLVGHSPWGHKELDRTERLNWTELQWCFLKRTPLSYVGTSLVAQTVKRLSTMRETRVRALGWEDPLKKEMAIHSSTIAWKIPWTEEPGRLKSMGSQRVRHNWATSLSHKAI